MVMVSELEVLEKAHEIVLEGWAQGTGIKTSYDGGVIARCSTVAINYACQAMGADAVVRSRALITLGASIPAEYQDRDGSGIVSCIQRFNDDRTRTTLADVSDAFYDAIEYLREEW